MTGVICFCNSVFGGEDYRLTTNGHDGKKAEQIFRLPYPSKTAPIIYGKYQGALLTTAEYKSDLEKLRDWIEANMNNYVYLAEPRADWQSKYIDPHPNSRYIMFCEKKVADMCEKPSYDEAYYCSYRVDNKKIPSMHSDLACVNYMINLIETDEFIQKLRYVIVSAGY